jgi:hypothetical protein
MFKSSFYMLIWTGEAKFLLHAFSVGQLQSEVKLEWFYILKWIETREPPLGTYMVRVINDTL